MKRILGSYRAMKFGVLPIIKTRRKIHMISFKNYEYSGDKLQDDITTRKHIVTFTMLVDTTVNTGF